ncbi:MAG: fumarylacetoacetate hydrolase family protein [Paludibacteraceae bacterium]|nr:fumarylacetoacetate hydrolase family protein [Paludibacteraceae bacterium]
MKIICVGWNYPKHNLEMNRDERPQQPTIFMKPDSALLRENRPFFIPRFSNQIEHEVELVVRINRLGRNIAPRFAHRYYSEVALGVDFTARDLQNQCKQLGAPWEISKAFDNSAVVSDFISLSELSDIQDIHFSFRFHLSGGKPLCATQRNRCQSLFLLQNHFHTSQIRK